jgi:hypothetical protein
MNVLAHIIVWVSIAYAAAGLVFAIPFAIAGIERIDPAARGTSIGFRLLILPGAILLWPLLLRRWLNRKSGHQRLGPSSEQPLGSSLGPAAVPSSGAGLRSSSNLPGSVLEERNAHRNPSVEAQS